MDWGGSWSDTRRRRSSVIYKIMKEKGEYKECGITLIELMVTFIIVGIVAGLAFPLITKAIENTRAKQAMVSLKQIRTGERVYRTQEDTYFYSNAGSTREKIEEINDKLNLYLDVHDKRDWNYKVEAGETAGSTFDATATRNGGAAAYNGKTIILDEGGPPFTGTWPLPLP